MRKLTAIVAASALLTACGGDDSPTPRPGAALTYLRTGGVAATPQRLVVEADGASSLATGVPGSRRRSRFTLSAEQSAELQELARKAELPALSAEPQGPVTCADCYLYRVTYAGVRVERAEPDLPAALAGLVSALQDVVAAHGGG